VIKTGFTHYWDTEPKDIPEEALVDIRKIVDEHKDIIQYESDIKDKPIVNKNEIIFNGIGRNGHETFWYNTRKEGFGFCKTARKPYDIVVCKVLLVLEAHMGINLRSDGFSNDRLSFDGSWNQAIEDVKRMGYIIQSKVESREDSRYYDCEIISIKPGQYKE